MEESAHKPTKSVYTRFYGAHPVFLVVVAFFATRFAHVHWHDPNFGKEMGFRWHFGLAGHVRTTVALEYHPKWNVHLQFACSWILNCTHIYKMTNKNQRPNNQSTLIHVNNNSSCLLTTHNRSVNVRQEQRNNGLQKQIASHGHFARALYLSIRLHATNDILSGFMCNVHVS